MITVELPKSLLEINGKIIFSSEKNLNKTIDKLQKEDLNKKEEKAKEEIIEKRDQVKELRKILAEASSE